MHGSLLKKTAHGAVTWSGLHGGGRQAVRSRRTTWSRSDQITGDVCGSFKRLMSPGRAEVRAGLFYHFTGRSSHFPGCQLVSVRPHLVIFTDDGICVKTSDMRVTLHPQPATLDFAVVKFSLVVNERWNLHHRLTVWSIKRTICWRVMAVLCSRAGSFSSHLCCFGPFSVEQPACGGGGRVIQTFSQQLEMFKFRSFVFLVLTAFLDCSKPHAANSAPFQPQFSIEMHFSKEREETDWFGHLFFYNFTVRC